jgi:hypothetical protein
VAVNHVDPADRLLDRRDLQALPSLAALYDLACKPCDNRAFQYIAGQETSGIKAYRGIYRMRFFSYVFVGYIFYSQLLYICL